MRNRKGEGRWLGQRHGCINLVAELDTQACGLDLDALFSIIYWWCMISHIFQGAYGIKLAKLPRDYYITIYAKSVP